MNFDIITYIKPNHDFDVFKQTLSNIQNSKYINKVYISFVENLNDKFIDELHQYKNIIWKDQINNFWADEMLSLINKSDSEYIYNWEEDSNIYNINQFDKTFENFIKKGADHMLTLDKKWIERGKFLLENQLAIQENEFLYFNWGTDYAKYCRESSTNSLVNGAYPVTVGSMFTKKLLVSLLNKLVDSKYWKNIISGNFEHYHRNPKLPHSFEVFPGFWWKGINDGYGHVQYTTMVSGIQFGEELGGRLIDKLDKPKKENINIVGYDTWYSEGPWNRFGTNLKTFDVTYNNFKSDITYFIKDGIFEIEKDYKCNIKIALLTECRIIDPRRHNYLEQHGHLFDYIATYDDQLIEQFPDKVIITPYGGTWIHPTIQKIYSKSKICSYITSKKTYTKDQHDRISLLDYFYENKNIDIELFGRGHNPLLEDHETKMDGKIDALKDFMYSIVIENHQQNNYFSEKLLDCFLTGTIPIYHGCKHIEKYFNIDGMIILDKIEDAKSIVPELTFEKYNLVFEAVQENYNSAKKYIDSLSYSYQKLKKGKI